MESPVAQKIIFASQNKHKIEEVNQILRSEFFTVLGMSGLGFTEDIPETGSTLEENALLKASFLADRLDYSILSDDSGLEVEILDGAPGVYSARYAGMAKSDLANLELLLQNMEGKSNRNAQFRTVMVLIHNGTIHSFEGIIKGRIIEESRGTGGFGYDPIFIPDGYNKTFGELPAIVKNKISHRARALEKVRSFLSKK